MLRERMVFANKRVCAPVTLWISCLVVRLSCRLDVHGCLLGSEMLRSISVPIETPNQYYCIYNNEPIENANQSIFNLPHQVYYVAIGVDLLLRVVWTLTLVPEGTPLVLPKINGRFMSEAGFEKTKLYSGRIYILHSNTLIKVYACLNIKFSPVSSHHHINYYHLDRDSFDFLMSLDAS